MRFKTIICAATLLGAMNSSAFENIDFTRAAEATVNGVVSIKSYTTPRQSANRFSNPFFEYFFGSPQDYGRQQQPSQSQPIQSGLGSGVIIDAEGYIVTNNHVIDGAEKLEVTLNDNRTFEATVIGTDPATDLALIKISDADNLHVIPFGDSEALKVGEWVLAVGNPFGFNSSVTSGIVSAKARNISSTSGNRVKGIESYIQTDAAVNPGNSGGALVTLDGRLVGINTAIYSQTGNYSGASFAIPVGIVSKVVDDLRNYGNVQRAVLGVEYLELTPELAKQENINANAGLYIGNVIAGSAALEAGLQKGDLIRAINNHPTLNTGQLQEIMARLAPGDTITVSIIRDNEPMDVEVTLRNAKGDTGITRQGDVASLGANFQPLDKKEIEKLGIKSGLKVAEVTDGKFRSAGIKSGFIIIDINNSYVTSAAEVESLYKAITSSTEYDHVMFITGVYPNSPRRVYYAVDLAE